MASQRSRGRGNPDREEYLKLCQDDRRKLYGLLDGDIPGRMRRQELAMAALLVLSGGQVYAAVKGTTIASMIVGIFH